MPFKSSLEVCNLWNGSVLIRSGVALLFIVGSGSSCRGMVQSGSATTCAGIEAAW